MAAGLNALPLAARAATIRWHETGGEGPPVVFLPAISVASVANFLAVATSAALAGRRAVFLDYLGSGVSDPAADGRYDLAAHVESVAAVIEALGAGPVTVAGHSMGGTVAVGLALARPDLVAGVIVAEGNVTPGGGGHSRRIAAQSLADFAATGFAAFLAEIESKARAGDRAQAAFAASWRQAEVAGVHGNARMLVGLADDFFDRFLALDLPRVFVFGEKSHPAAQGHATPDSPDPDRLIAAGVAVEVVAGAGHLMVLEAPEAFAAIVARHLATSA